jgi:hypothetical protein
VLFDCLLGKADPVPDLLVLEAFGHELQDHRLPVREPPATHMPALAMRT